MALTLATQSACEGCRDEKPYTPFGVTSALPSQTATASAPSGSGAVAAPNAPPNRTGVRKAVFTPKGAQRFRVTDRELEAPPLRVFEQVLEADFDGDGTEDVAAWTLAGPDSQPSTAPGELWLYPAKSEHRKIFDFPAFVPNSADCRHTSTLLLAGASTISLDIRAHCEEPRVARTPTRALALIDPLAPLGLRFGLRVAEPAPGEVLSLSLSVRDEDTDGREDFRLSAALSEGSPESVRASLVWLDRAAGVSRDSREPASGLEAVLSNEVIRARAKKNAPLAVARTQSVRRLLSTLCAEGKAARIFEWEGGELRCNNLGTVIDRAAAVEVTAALTLSNLPAAFGALSRDGWYFGSMSERQRRTLIADIEKKVRSVPASRIALGARPSRVNSPGFSPLTFQADGSLLMQTDSGLFRQTPDGAREEPVEAESGVAPWPTEATTQAGARLLGVSYSCDRSEIALLMAGGSNPAQAIPLLAPRPGVCGGQRFDEGFVPALVSAGRDVEILVGGERFGPLGDSPPGSARSADGRWLALSTRLGLLIQGEPTELWKIEGWEGASGCVVANEARRAACIRNGRAELYLKTEAP